ncbi:MAG TPA: hypothetical protein PLP39_08640 [Flavobacterium lutivivi]|nr:hypothetical protein [Flavobacterium lutivivi]
MKVKIISILAILFLISCNRNYEKKELIGIWKRTNPLCPNCVGYSQKTIFSADSLIYEEFEKGKLENRISTAYKFDKSSNTVFYDAGNNIIKLKVTKLTDTEMELFNHNDKEPMKYIREK